MKTSLALRALGSFRLVAVQVTAQARRESERVHQLRVTAWLREQAIFAIVK
jgi:hypothetical protein